MLGFFRRHQKSFMLIFLVPGLLAMGITGAVMQVASNPGDQVAGVVLGEKVFLRDFDHHRQLYRITNPSGEEEEAWRFLAFYKAARRAGIEVSSDEVRDSIQTDMKWIIAQYRAMDELEKLGIDQSNPDFRRQWQQLVFQKLGDADKAPLDIDEYKKILRTRYGVDHRTFEEQQRRELAVRKLLDTFRDLGAVSPADVRKAYLEKHELRALDLGVVSAARYAPSLEAKSGQPGYVSDEQVRRYYERRELDFDEPRLVNLDVVSYVFADAVGATGELASPSDEQLEAYNRWRHIADVNSFSENEDAIRDAYYADEARKRGMDVLERVAQAVTAAREGKAEASAPLDLAAITQEVAKATGSKVLRHLTTGQIPLEELAAGERSILAGRAAEGWFRSEEAGQVSGVLGNAQGLFLLQSREVRHAKTPKYEDVLPRVREAYVNGTPQERKAYYDQRKNLDYRKDISYAVDVAVYRDAKFDGDHARAKEALEKTRAKIAELVASKSGPWAKKERFEWRLLETETAFDQMEWVKLDEKRGATVEELTKHEVMAKAATAVPTVSRWKLETVEFDGGWGLYRVTRQLPVEALPYEQVEERVRADLAQQRGLERAEEAAEELLAKLKHKRGEDLEQAIKELGLERLTTEPFAREAVSLKGIPNAGQLVGEAFSTEAVVGGGFFRAVPDQEGRRVLLVRVASRQDPPEDGYREAYQELRDELLRKARADFAATQVRELILRAKGIEEAHMDYAARLRDGAGGVTRLKLRQIALPPDKQVTGQWLERAARARAEEAQAELAKGTPWGRIVDRYSEHEATRSREGELPPSSRSDLADTYGIAFAEEAFQLANGGEPKLIASTRGVHLIRALEDRGARRVFQHVLISNDPQRRSLPAEVQQQAEAAAKAALEKAAAALASGQPFGRVAEEHGDKDDAIGQGQEFELEFVTPFERAALAQCVDWEAPADHPQANSEVWVPEVVEVKAPEGTTWQLFLCMREQSDREPAWKDIPARDRVVYHVQSATREGAEQARAEMQEFIQDQVDSTGDRPSVHELLRHFQQVAAKRSEAPDRTKGGAFGVVRLEPRVRGYGQLFLEQACFQPDGSPVTAGYRTAVFRGDHAFHLIEVVEVVKAEAGDDERKGQVAQLVLDGTGWQ